MAGAEIQAAAISTMFRGSPLRDVSQLIDILAIVALGCLGALAGLRRLRVVGALAVCAVALLYLTAAQLAFHEGWVLAVVVPIATLTLVAVCIGLTDVVRAIRRGRARSTGGAP